MGTLKRDVNSYLETVFKRAHLYGSDLREALIEVAHLMVQSNSQSQAVCTLRKYILCLVQISKILYSKDANRTAKQCLQFYNCVFVSHELHLELFGETLNNMYFHALFVHGPMQHEVVCSRSVNTESEERLFKSAESAAKCTDRKPENMLPGILKRLQLKRENIGSDPITQLCKKNSRINTHAEGLPVYPGTKFAMDWVKKRVYAWQAHLKRISHYLIEGKGAWWNTMESGDVCFDDDGNDLESVHKGSCLLHFRTSELSDVVRRSKFCWDKCIRDQLELPIEVVRTFNEDGSFEAVSDVQPATQEMEVSLNSSALCSELPPLISPSGTEADFQITFMKPPTVVSTPGPSYCEEGFQGTDEPDGGGSVDMAVDIPETVTNCEFKSTVCKALGKLLGNSTELEEFDKIKHSTKSKRLPLPSEIEMYKRLAKYIRRLVGKHKITVEQSLEAGESESAQYLKCTKDLKLCLQLLCNLS